MVFLHGDQSAPLAQPAKNVEIVFIRDRKQWRTTTQLAVHPDDAKPFWQSIPPAQDPRLAPGVLRGAAFEAILVLLAVITFSLAGREITRPEWDLEWLATLPLPLPTLLASRFVERSVTNAAGFILFMPFLTVVAWNCGYRWIAPLLGIGLAMVLLLIVATIQTLIDTGLRLAWSPASPPSRYGQSGNSPRWHLPGLSNG